MPRAMLLCLVLLGHTGRIAAEDVEPETPVDDVDRTDFSEQHLQEDRPKGPLVPSTEVAAASLMPDLALQGKVPVGIDNVLLVSLANLGSRMYNVTKVEGYLQTLSGAKVERFAARVYGEPLNPREQRSFRYAFAVNEERKLGEYRMVFSIFYTNKEKDPFSDVAYNETAELVRKPPASDDMLLLYGGIAAAALAVGAALVTCMGKSRTSEPKKKSQAKDAAAPAKDEWLADTLIPNDGKPKKGKKRA